jgi:hypothetical protein
MNLNIAMAPHIEVKLSMRFNSIKMTIRGRLVSTVFNNLGLHFFYFKQISWSGSRSLAPSLVRSFVRWVEMLLSLCTIFSCHWKRDQRVCNKLERERERENKIFILLLRRGNHKSARGLSLCKSAVFFFSFFFLIFRRSVCGAHTAREGSSQNRIAFQ